MLTVLTCAQLAHGEEALDFSNTICGQRCVVKVLEHFGNRTRLALIVKDFQELGVNGESSFQNMVDVLGKNKVVVAAVNSKGDRYPIWPHPIVRHAILPDSRQHFFLQIPESIGQDGNEVYFWDPGLGYLGSVPSGWKVSDTCLLTSDIEISETEISNISFRSPFLRIAGDLVPLFFGTAIGFVFVSLTSKIFARRC